MEYPKPEVFSYPVVENPQDEPQSKNLPPEKIFVIVVSVILVVGFLIYGISKATTSTKDYHKFDLNKKNSDEQVAGTSVVGPYGKPIILPTATPAPTENPTPVESSETNNPTSTPAPTSKPEPTNSPAPTHVPDPTNTPTPTATASPTETPTETPTVTPTDTP